MLNTVVLSDIHLGDPYSLMHDQGVPPTLDLIKIHAQGHVRRLVLAGDIFEMTVPESLDRVHNAAHFFFQQIRSRFQVDELVWVPGNHDYSLFRNYVPTLLATDWRGDPAPRDFVHDFIGDWKGTVRIAYPHLMLTARPGGKPTGQSWIIHHGHYLDHMILGLSQADRVEAFFSALAGGNAVRPKQVPISQPLTLTQVEELVRPVVGGIWRFHPDPNNLQSDFWQLLRRWSSYLSCPGREPDLIVHDNSEANILSDATLQLAAFYLRAARRDPAYPKNLGPAERPTLVWGHSHNGGIRTEQVDGLMVRLINLGGWVPAENETDHGREPHTHIFFINDDLRDMMMVAPFPAEWVSRCVDHGRSVYAIPGPDDALIEEEATAPPAAGMSVDEMMKWLSQRPFGQTQSNEDPFA